MTLHGASGVSNMAIFFKAFIEIQFRLYAYAIGYSYLFIVYLLSFPIPPLKRVLRNFENGGGNYSIAIISLISGSLLFSLFVLIISADRVSNTSLLVYVGMYFGYFIWGYFALFLLLDYRSKAKSEHEDAS